MSRVYRVHVADKLDHTSPGEPLRKAHVGLREALTRMDSSWGKTDKDHFFASSLEAAMWIVALNDFLRRVDPDYDQRRDDDPGGRIVRGLSWVRNNGIHGLIDVHEVNQGATFPLRFPVRFEHASWKLRADVPGARGQSEENEETYDDNVAGKVVQNTLREAQDFLWMRAVPVPSEDPDSLF